MELATRPEPNLDFVETARLATEGFGMPGVSFQPARLEWLYDTAFSEGTTVLSLYAEDKKVGQVALVRQRVRTGGTAAMAIALMDLFILKPYRSRAAIAGLYGAVERLCQEGGPRFILAVPNGNAAGVNAKFLALERFLTLDIRAGVALPLAGRTIASADARQLGPAEAEVLFARFLPDRSSGLAWTAAGLWQRLQDPSHGFAVHATESLLLISAQRVLRRVPHTLLCAFFARPGASVSRTDVNAVTAAACLLQRRPFFVYVGLNGAVPLPGWSLPERLRPSPMVVQLRDFQAGPTPVTFDRFESLDFDFA